ncbi:acetylcholinesterase isoform X2 [Nilaparvata lugens]|uniref:acetylcholinesterase isoform X2 n=1 Tax=Nilaparvata lugens TaxID=108931 RepID=UPI00193E16CA|nr:acetylcholinesterase isoform X2 [Nilaparvata lugens]
MHVLQFQVEGFRLDHKEDCVVEDTNQNTYIGRKKLSMLNNVPFCSYLGIPYAEPPTGHRRFKDPIAVQLWGEEREARMEGSECMQSEPLFNMGKVIGSEDCLYLNVYTQYSSNSSLPGKLKAVMVWIHGGGFVFGSGSPSIYGPDFLIQHNIVLVTFNYRLGAFGFLNLRNEDVPGNAGLKDQVLVLKWVRKNIQSFGGDPNSVTLFGESAGASSIQLHMMSPLSTDLFHRVIMQSGSVYCPWTFIRDPLDRANQLGSHLQINTTDPIKLAQGLRNVSSYQLTLAQSQLSTNQDMDRGLYFPFIPSTEMVGTGISFMAEDPDLLLKRGLFVKVPTIVGVNSREGIMVLLGRNATPEVLNELDKNFQRVVPDILNLTPNTKKFKEVTDKIKRFYFRDGQLSWDSLENYVDLMGDIYFVAPIYRSMMNMIKKSPEPVFCYKFAFEGSRGLVKSLTKAALPDLKNISGVSHYDDIPYLFPVSIQGWQQEIDSSSMERRTIDRLTTLWTNFAKTGNPNGCEWDPHHPARERYLYVSDDLQVRHRLIFQRRMNFWKDIYDNHSNNSHV